MAELSRVNPIHRIFIIGLAGLLILSTVQMSMPLVGYLVNHDHYIYECRVIQHHSSQCGGVCILKHELADHAQRKSEIPYPSILKHLKIIDLNLVPSFQVPYYFELPVQLFSYYPHSLVDRLAEIEIPPPRFSTL
jgi:hypothetical protein